MKCPTILFTIKGLCSNCLVTVTKCVWDTWADETTMQFIQNGIAMMPESKCKDTRHSIQMFLDSMWVEMLETKGEGGLKKPTFNVYADGSHINNPNAWSNIRSHPAMRSYYSNKFSHGRNEAPPKHCSFCYGVGYPRGICPFPRINSWKGPENLDKFM